MHDCVDFSPTENHNRPTACHIYLPLCFQEEKLNLRSSLQNLPAPKNDFEIVLPENEDAPEEETGKESNSFVEDAADVETMKQVRELLPINRKCHSIFSLKNACFVLCNLVFANVSNN